jgi:asparagine synthase (glutamine-hydrolysing)
LQQQGLFVVAPIALKWQQHVSAQRDWSSQLWGVLMVQAWLETYHHGKAPGVAT